MYQCPTTKNNSMIHVKTFLGWIMSHRFPPFHWSLPRLPQNQTAVWPVTWGFDCSHSPKEFSVHDLFLDKTWFSHLDTMAHWSPAEWSLFYVNTSCPGFPLHSGSSLIFSGIMTHYDPALFFYGCTHSPFRVILSGCIIISLPHTNPPYKFIYFSY